MLSRISRMSTMSAQFVSGCSLLGEHPTAPKPFVKANPLIKCDTFEPSRERSTSSWSDPFIGHHEHEQFLAELSELDLLKNNHTFENAASSDLSTPNAVDWNAFIDDLDWMDEFGPLDLDNVGREDTITYPNSTSPCSTEDFLEKTAALIDWKAWNHYLSNDWEADLNFLSDKDEEKYTQDHGSPVSRYRSKIISEKTSSPSQQEQKVSTTVDEVQSPRIPVVPASGPLTWIPSIKDDRHVEECKTEVMSWCSSSSTRESTPERVIKRRGVKMKPPSDEGTNHRRSLNREAAFRYRERKRIEQRERKRELEQLLCHNSILKQQLKQLRWDIAEWKNKVNQITN
ncbi:unnamed protein product [Cylicocyclus nassatus]|uniref:BZIP domain-containing protein n=1 Tax=Cylicocyclus nassatus TaxID=53992 RepID=A0AA36DPF2_CYLNA|nr:unnamed protein product [Cylicocyclus nassatus]